MQKTKTKAGIAAALALCFMLNGVVAANDGPPADSEGRVLIEKFLADVTSFRADFSQSVVDADGAVVDTSSGSLEILKPGRFRWTTVEPYEQLLLADGLNVWSYDVDLAQVTVKPQAEALASTPALLLGGDREALDQFSVGRTLAESGLTTVRLEPRDTSSGFLAVDLVFAGEALSRMVFLDNLDQQTIVAFSDVDTNPGVDPERFVFSIPDDADVVGTPVAAETF